MLLWTLAGQGLAVTRPMKHPVGQSLHNVTCLCFADCILPEQAVQSAIIQALFERSSIVFERADGVAEVDLDR